MVPTTASCEGNKAGSSANGSASILDNWGCLCLGNRGEQGENERKQQESFRSTV